MQPAPPLLDRPILTKRTALFGLLLLGVFSAHAADSSKIINYTGHYERTDSASGQFFSLDLTQSKTHVNVSFSAGNTDGSGAAPDGGGEGEIDRSNVLRFTFKDSFDNEGAGTISLSGNVYRITLDGPEAQDARAVQLYGTFSLKRMASKSSSP